MDRKIYSIIGSTPETAAYGMAKYSRSSLGLQESLRELSAQKTAEFLNTFYFQYGHSSIADLAHVAVALEQISIWAAMVVVDEPLWDGQERSTRYQDFKKTRYYTPTGAPEEYTRLADVALCPLRRADPPSQRRVCRTL
nr:Thymidylate synthase complementing protein [uncultured bacterium]